MMGQVVNNRIVGTSHFEVARVALELVIALREEELGVILTYAGRR